MEYLSMPSSHSSPQFPPQPPPLLPLLLLLLGFSKTVESVAIVHDLLVRARHDAHDPDARTSIAAR